MRLLIVEDQSSPLETLEYAVNKVMPSQTYDMARCYSDAEKMIAAQDYDIVILDNRMPYECQGDMERTDFDRYCSSLRNIGYRLIPEIKLKNPCTVVIGTSSLSERELSSLPNPDYRMRKMWGEAEADLEGLMSQLLTQKE